jgi:hypothetical protein
MNRKQRVLTIRALVAFVAIAAPLQVRPAPKEEPKPVKEKSMAGSYADFALEKGFFKCSAPTGWRRIRDERDDARTNSYGVLFDGPAGDEGVSPTVSVRYYGPGNPVAKDASSFLDRQLRPGLIKLAGEQTSKPSETLLDGRKASAFTRNTYEMWPPNSIDSKRVPVKEETIVIQHDKGFFVLDFSATASSFKKWQPVFQHVRESFHVTR